VLKHADLGEADRLLTLYTADQGKIKALVKGARKLTSKLAGYVEPLTHCSLMLAQGRNMDTITQAQIIESFPLIRNDLRRIAQASYLVELVDAFTPERVSNYPIYTLLLNSLRWLSKTSRVEILFRYFELQLLGYLGYRPQLQECLNCRAKLEPVENFFSASGGGMLCPNCAHTEPVVQPLSVNALKVMRLLQDGDYTTAFRLRLTPELSQELERVLQGYISYLLERELKSTEFLDRLYREGTAVYRARFQGPNSKQ